MLQLGRQQQKVDKALVHEGCLQDPTGVCSGMSDVQLQCGGSNGCQVLAANMAGRSCDTYCASQRYMCVGAWQAVGASCEPSAAWTCDQQSPGLSTLLCQCVPRKMCATTTTAAAPGSAAGTAGSSTTAATTTPTAATSPAAATTSAPVPGTSGTGANARPGLTLVWSDEFDGGAVDTSKWGFEVAGGGYGNKELQFYTSRPVNAHVDGGTLKIVAQCEQYGGQQYTSARLTTRPTAAWGPGHRVEVRARLPSNVGSWPAIWMLPRDRVYGGWPNSGEIDIMEAVGCDPGNVYGTVHTQAYNHVLGTQKGGHTGVATMQWHVYALDWVDGLVQFSVDGAAYYSFTPDDRSKAKWPFDQNFYLLLNVAVGGTWGGMCLPNGGAPSCTDPNQFGQPAVMEVDYARVYSINTRAFFLEA